MKALEQAIIERAVGIGNEIVKVDMFLNHKIDVELATQIGYAFRDAFKQKQVDIVLTIEASGIATAITTAQAFGNVPVVFAKKSKTNNSGNDAYTSRVYSFTHQKENTIRVSKEYLPCGKNVLIIDDFLANGEATEGLIDIINQAGCTLSGVGICIEKGFQPGGKRLRDKGIDLVSLAIVDAITDGKIHLRENG